MSTNNAVAVLKTRKNNKSLIQNSILQHIINFVLGIMFSVAGFNTDFSPFGAAFVASVGKNYTVTAALGAALGWFLSVESVDAFRYTAVSLAICVIMGALKPFKQIREHTATPSVCVFVCLMVTGLASEFAEGITLVGALLAFSEAVLGGASSFLFLRCRGIIHIKGGLSMLTSKDATAVTVCSMLLLLALKNISVFNIFPAHIIASLLILVCAYYGRESGGAIVGVCGGLAMSLAGDDVLLLGFYAFGGLLAGVFCGFGRLASFAAFVFSGVALSAVAYKSFDNGAIITETVIAGVLFMVLSTVLDKKLKDFIRPTSVSPVADVVKNGVLHKLRKASEMSREIYESLSNVEDVLSKTEKNAVDLIQRKTKDSVCGSCGLYDVCWGEYFTETQDAFNTLLNMKKEGAYLEYKTVPRHFSGRCIRTESVASSFNKLYMEYVSRSKTENRIREMNALASQQFANVSSLLDSLDSKLNEDVYFDIDTASKIKATAVSCGYDVVRCACVIKTSAEMVVEIKIKSQNIKFDYRDLKKQISIITDRSFGKPLEELRNGYLFVTFKEKPDYSIESAVVQNCAPTERFCGDSFTTFEDDEGKFYAVICDGMGTGTKAALSSGLAVSLLEKLIKAGFGIKSSVNTVNSSLLSRSGDECSVTLDLVVVDLYTGKTEFYKCGASDTTVRKGNSLINVNYSSLPLGILSDTEISCGSGNVSYGDVIVMASDGVREEDLLLLRRELKTFKDGDISQFTSSLCEKIRKYQTDRQDDMTILTFMIKDNRQVDNYV